MSDCAFLNNSGNFTAFTYNGRTIRFRTPSSLERYTDILEWDKGYLVVMAKYKGAPAEEEYIDLVLGAGEFDFLYEKFGRNVFAAVELTRALTDTLNGAWEKRVSVHA